MPRLLVCLTSSGLRLAPSSRLEELSQGTWTNDRWLMVRHCGVKGDTRVRLAAASRISASAGRSQSRFWADQLELSDFAGIIDGLDEPPPHFRSTPSSAAASIILPNSRALH